MSSLTRVLLLDSPSGTSGPSKVQKLKVYKQFFRNEDDSPITLIGSSDFNLLNRYDQSEDIRPILEDRQGANYLRVWTSYDIPNIGTMINCPYGKIHSFVALCNSYGYHVEFTGYTGINDPNHWSNLISAALRCEIKPLLELVNELDQNLNEPDYLGRTFHLEHYAKPPDDILSSHGSNGSQAQPVQEYWDYVTFHDNDAPEWWRKNGHNAMEIWDGPSLTDESTRTDHENGPNSGNRYYDAAAGGSLLCAGTLLHSPEGKDSTLFGVQSATYFDNHVAGTKSVNLICQEGDYSHKEEQIKEENWEFFPNGDPNPEYDPSAPSYMRVYKRGSEQVYIRFNP